MSATIAGIVLAGGQSRRMGGGDKALLEIGGRSMLGRVIDRLHPQVVRVVLNANGDPGRFAEFGLPVIEDTISGHAGPLAGVLSGLEWAGRQGGFSHVATVAADTPFFPKNFVARLSEAAEGAADRIALATSGGNRHPVFGLWPLTLTGELRDFLQSSATFKVMAFVGSHDFRLVEFPMAGTRDFPYDPFFNANAPEDLVLAERLTAEEGR